MAIVTLLGVTRAVGADEQVPLYTTEDLERMYGPSTAPDRPFGTASEPEDWTWVEQYLDRQYARLDADRAYDLSRRSLDIEEQRVSYAPTYAYAYPYVYSSGFYWNHTNRGWGHGGGNGMRGMHPMRSNPASYWPLPPSYPRGMTPIPGNRPSHGGGFRPHVSPR